MPVSIASTARRRVDLEGVLVASSMSTSLVIVGRRQRRRRSGGAALLSSSSTRPSRSPGWPSRTFTRSACAATARVLSQYALLQISGSVWILRVASRRHPNMHLHFFDHLSRWSKTCETRIRPSLGRFGFYVSLAATLNDKFDRARLQPLPSRLSLLRRMFSIEL